MPIARPMLGFLAMIVLAGGLVMQFFIVLSGTHIGMPENRIYFLQAATDGVTGGNSNVHNPVRWTYFSICGVANGLNYDCGRPTPALPFDPERNFGTSTGLPSQFSNHARYFYLSRFAWVFYLIALFFGVVALLLSVFALCARLGAYLTGLNAALALFFQSLAAALMTAWTVQARNAFRSNGQTASLGRYMYGFTWGTWAAFFIATLLFCIGGSVGRNDSYQKSSYFGRKRSTRSARSRGSFIDSESQRRVKDEYD